MYVRARIFWRKDGAYRNKILSKTWFLLWRIPIFAHETILDSV